MASIELALLVLMLFLCHRRYRIKKEQHVRALNMRISQPHSRGNPFLVDPFAYTSPRCSIGTVSRQNSLKKQPFLRATDELVMDHTENGFSTQGFNEQQKDIWDDTPDEIKNPHLVEINLGATVGRRDRDPEDHSVRQPYRPKPRQTPHGDGTTGRTRALVIAPSRAYHPSPGWRRIDEIPSPAYLNTLSVAEDDESDHQLPTPTSITHPKAAICPDRIYSRDASTNKPWPYGISVDPEDCMTTTSCSEDDCDRLAIARQRPPFDGLRQSSPPPRPPKSPLRRAESIRAMPDVSFPLPFSPIFLPSFERSLTTRSRLQIRESQVE